MASVDNKVVNMKLNNKQFEDGISTTLASLGKLKQGLNMSDAAKSFNEVEKAAEKVTLSGIAKSLETLNDRFSTFGIMGMQVLQNITDMAMRTGTQLVKSLTISPMMEGLQEYETQINAIQTIMSNTASKGTTLPQVNEALNELNKYADMTIYNFTEMTRNIGTFTAAGVDLDTSVGAIKGIANLAAASGSTSQQASTAMYQLSQALSSGTVKLQDWNSVVNAGMGGQLFQDALTETARVHGIGIDKMIKEEGSFRETLSEGWLTSSILTETLSKFTGDLTQEQLLSMGYTQKQAKEIIALGSMANDAATKVKTLTQLGETLGEAVGSGWAQTWQLLIGDFDQAKELFTGISDTLSEIINASSDARNDMIKGWVDLGGRTKIIDAVAVAWRNAYDIVSRFLGGIKSITGSMTSEKLFGMTEAFEKLVYALTPTEEALKQLETVGAGVGVVINALKTGVKLFAGGIFWVIDALSPLAGILLTTGEFLGDLATVIYHSIESADDAGETFGRFVAIMDRVKNKIKNVLNGINDAFKSWDWLDFMHNIDSAVKPIGLFSGALTLVELAMDGIGIALSKVTPLIISLTKNIGKAFGWLGEQISKVIGSTTTTDVKNVGIVAVLGFIFVKVRKFINGLGETLDEAGGLLESLTSVFDGVQGSLEAWQNNLKADTLLKLAGAIAILAAALLIIASIDSDKLVGSLAAMGVMFGEMLLAMSMITKMNKGLKGQAGLVATSTAMIGMATALIIMAGALKILASVPFTSMMKGIYGVGMLLAMMVVTTKYMTAQEGKIVKTSAAMILFAVALKMLVKPVVQLSAVPFSSLVKGLGALAAIFAILAVFMNTANFDKKSVSSAVGMILLASAIKSLTKSVENLSQINASSLVKALGALGAIFVMLQQFVKHVEPKNLIATGAGLILFASAVVTLTDALGVLSLIPATSLAKSLLALGSAMTIMVTSINLLPKDSALRAGGILILSVAMEVLTKALAGLSVIPFTSLVKSLLALGVSLGIMVIAANAMTGSLAGAAAILVLAAALNVLVPALRAFGEMTKQELVKSVLMLASIFGIFGIAGYALAPVTPVILALSAAIGIFGLAAVAVGVGIAAFGLGMTALAASGAASATVLKLMMLEMATALPDLLTALAESMIEFVVAIGNGADKILATLVKLIATVLDAIIQSTPKIVETFNVLLKGIIDIVVINTPLIIDAAFALITKFLSAIRDNIGPITQIAIDIIVKFVDTIAKNMGRIIDSAFNLIISFINGLADTIRKRTPEILSAGKNIITALIKGATDAIKGIGSIGVDFVKGIIGGVTSMGKNLVDAGKNVVGGAVDGIKNFLGIKSPSRLMMGVGGDFGSGLVIGIKGMAKNVARTSVNLGKTAVTSINKALSKTVSLADDSLDMNPVITPVLDLTNFNKSVSEMDSTLGSDKTINVDGVVEAARSTSSQVESTVKSGQNGSTSNNTEVTFNQTINSPKQIDQLEIYRQTRNQLKDFKREVKPA